MDKQKEPMIERSFVSSKNMAAMTSCENHLYLLLLKSIANYLYTVLVLSSFFKLRPLKNKENPGF